MARTEHQSVSHPLGITPLRLAIGVGAAVLIGGTFAMLAPPVASAHPQYAVQTKLPCGQCHTSPSGGGKLTAFGRKYKANGHKVK